MSDGQSQDYQTTPVESNGPIEGIGSEPQTSSEQPQESAQSDEFSAKFAALSRKEKELREQMQAFEDQRSEYDQWKSQQAEMAQQEKTPDIDLRYLKKDPVSALKAAGWEVNDVLRLINEDGNLPIDKKLDIYKDELESKYQERFEEMERKLAEKEQQEEQARYDQVLNNFKSEINSFVDTSNECELIKLTDSQDLVFDVIEDYHKETGKVLDIEEAAKQVEEYLYEDMGKLLEKSEKLKGFSGKKPLNSEGSEATLTNSLSAQSRTVEADKKLNREESLAKAASMLRWND